MKTKKAQIKKREKLEAATKIARQMRTPRRMRFSDSLIMATKSELKLTQRMTASSNLTVLLNVISKRLKAI